jgi:hypothetical protein
MKICITDAAIMINKPHISGIIMRDHFKDNYKEIAI